MGTALIPLFLWYLSSRQATEAEKQRATAEREARQNRDRQTEIAQDNQQHQVMSSYLQQLSNLITKDNLSSPDSTHELRSVARSITLNAARQLDPERRGQLIKFLYENDLIGFCKSKQDGKILSGSESKSCQKVEEIVSLRGVKLSRAKIDSSLSLRGANLEGINLIGAVMTPDVFLQSANMHTAKLINADLSKSLLDSATMTFAELQTANLSESTLRNTDLSWADLTGAQLVEANLEGAILRNAKLVGADLTGVDLDDADLTGADLRCSILREAKLKTAKLINVKLYGAVYDEKTEFSESLSTKNAQMHKLNQGFILSTRECMKLSETASKS
jgi:uncharacterized protein YjbI with pentapeptide repeats